MKRLRIDEIDEYNIKSMKSTEERFDEIFKVCDKIRDYCDTQIKELNKAEKDWDDSLYEGFKIETKKMTKSIEETKDGFIVLEKDASELMDKIKRVWNAR